MEFKEGSNGGQSNNFNETKLGKQSQYIGNVNTLNIITDGQREDRVTDSGDEENEVEGTYRIFITHDEVGVPELIRKAQHHIVLHAAYYPKYGFDNQGDDLQKAMYKNTDLKLTAIFTDVENAVWVDEFAVTLRDYFEKKGEFASHLEITKQHFVRLRKKFGDERVRIIDTARLPMFPVILIDDTLIVGHYAHSSVIPPNGLWITIEHPKILTMYQDLLDGKEVKYETAEEGAILRYLEELMVELP